MNIIDRIIQLIEYLGIKQKDFCIKTGLSPTLISNAKSRASDIGGKNIASIVSAYPDLNINWLVLGAGDMWRTPQSNNHQNMAINGDGNNANQIMTLQDCGEQLREKDRIISNLEGKIEGLEKSIDKILKTK